MVPRYLLVGVDPLIYPPGTYRLNDRRKRDVGYFVPREKYFLLANRQLTHICMALTANNLRQTTGALGADYVLSELRSARCHLSPMTYNSEALFWSNRDNTRYPSSMTPSIISK
jgi:hypothetical protein